MSTKLSQKIDATLQKAHEASTEASTNNGLIRAQSTKIDAIDAIDATIPILSNGAYNIITAYPATGILYEINGFLSGHVRVRGRGNGAYPFFYLEMLDNVFGAEKDTVEVCSGSVKGCYTVDINPDVSPNLVADGQELERIPDNVFHRWRCDPPYNEETAKMYGTELPKFSKLLTEGARVIKPGSLMFLLYSQNVQSGTIGKGNIKRIGFIYMSVVPNNETRVLNIYVKLPVEKQEEHKK